MKPKKLLVTFDYELFLGKNSGSVDRCIIEPTSLIIQALKKYNIKGVFFIDTVYLVRLKEIASRYSAASRDYNAIVRQLRELAASGHYLFPHIHAHWMDAVYIEATNSWGLDALDRYRFHSLSDTMKDQMFRRSTELLNEIALPANAEHSIDGYRAGGWCIQPFTSFKPYFEKYGISNDFSVVAGLSSQSEDNYYDFRSANHNIYFFKDNVLKEEQGAFCEFPVSTVAAGSFSRFVHRVERKILWHLKVKNMGDGNSVKFSAKTSSDYADRVLSIDTLLLSKLSGYKRFMRQNDYTHFASHPKMISTYSIKLFDRFLKHVYSNYVVTSDFKKMKPDYAAQNSDNNRYTAQLY